MIGIKPPPLWTSMNAVHDYERTMTHTNKVFDHIETGRLMAAKASIEKVLPSWVRKNPNVVVAGGCWASQLQGEYYKDIDVFILDCPNSDKDRFRGLIKVDYEDGEDKTDDYARNNDKVDEVWTSKRSKVQIIFTKHQTRKDLINDFDYVHCKTSYSENNLYITRKIFDAIIKKQLIVQNGKNIQLWRKAKFLVRGYKEAVEIEPTLGDILAGALKSNPVRTHIAGGGGAGGYATSTGGGGGGGYIVPTTWIDEWQN
jgi:hypothetical protein